MIGDLAGPLGSAIVAIAEAAKRDPAVALAASERRDAKASRRDVRRAADEWARWHGIARVRERRGLPSESAAAEARAALLVLASMLPPEVWQRVGELEAAMVDGLDG